MASSAATDIQITTEVLPARNSSLEKKLFYVLAAVALIYAFLAGLKTIAEFDLGWQMATGRWIVQHHQIPSTEVFSYTAACRPWIYPVGSGLLFYGAFLLGGYALISWMVAAGCVGTVALLLWRGSLVSAVLAILAVPLIASRTTARAEMFTTVLFAAFLKLLWQQHETGRARLWLLPVLMAAWVNLHLGLAAGLALLAGYVLVEALEMIWPERRQTAKDRLRRSWPWLLLTFAATLANPWGWRIYSALLELMAPMAAHSEAIAEYTPARVSWTSIAGLSLRSPDVFLLLLLIGAIAIPVALVRRQLGAAVLLGGAALIGVRHIRFEGLFALAVVVIAGAVLAPALGALGKQIEDVRIRSILAVGATCMVVVLVSLWSADLATGRAYLGSTTMATFGTGLGWWFPQGAADFIERENLPGQLFNSYNEGGYVVWRLGPKYRDYLDGRGSPFGPELFKRSIVLMGTPPESAEWREEAQRYNINSILIPLGRYNGLDSFPVLRQFCASDTWRPVYLDEVSAVFVRRRPETERLIQRLQIDCATAPLPRSVTAGDGAKAFNQWANAAAVLKVLGRMPEAFAATRRALSIFPDNAYVHFTRADVLAETGDWREAEQQYLIATALEPNAVSWARLAKIYEQQGRWSEAIHAWEAAAAVSRSPWDALVSLGYAYLQAHHPKEALAAFDRAASSLPAQSDLMDNNSALANVAHGRARSWYYLGDLRRAVASEEQAARLLPDNADVWMQLATLYDLVGRSDDANKIRARMLTEENPPPRHRDTEN